MSSVCVWIVWNTRCGSSLSGCSNATSICARMAAKGLRNSWEASPTKRRSWSAAAAKRSSMSLTVRASRPISSSEGGTGTRWVKSPRIWIVRLRICSTGRSARPTANQTVPTTMINRMGKPIPSSNTRLFVAEWSCANELATYTQPGPEGSWIGSAATRTVSDPSPIGALSIVRSVVCRCRGGMFKSARSPAKFSVDETTIPALLMIWTRDPSSPLLGMVDFMPLAVIAAETSSARVTAAVSRLFCSELSTNATSTIAPINRVTANTMLAAAATRSRTPRRRYRFRRFAFIGGPGVHSQIGSRPRE